MLWQALGQVRDGPTESETKSSVLLLSIYLSKDICVGEPFNETTIRFVRLGGGTHPSLYSAMMVTVARKNYSAGTPFSLEQLLQ